MAGYHVTFCVGIIVSPRAVSVIFEGERNVISQGFFTTFFSFLTQATFSFLDVLQKEYYSSSVSKDNLKKWI